MRWALAKVAIATTVMVAVAFCIPLALMTRQVAEERAMTQASESAAGLITVLAATNDPAALDRALSADPAGADDRLAIHLPDAPAIGQPRVDPAIIAKVAGGSGTITRPVDGGEVYLRAVVLPDDRVAVIEVFIPVQLLTKGVPTAWLTLLGIGFLLVSLSVVMADRLGAKVVRSSRSLANASADFGAGDLSVRVKPQGPDELVEAGMAFNKMADRVGRLVDDERELAADLSHRLRTPLTALRLDAEALGDGPDARRMRASVDALESEIDAVIAVARKPMADRSTQNSDVAEIVRERMAMWSMLAEDHGRRFSTSGLDTPLCVSIPRDELMSCVDALVGNVFAHTPQNAPFSIEVNAAAGRFIVEDGGSGIDDPMSALTRGESGAGSSGLGLDIVGRVAKAGGGRLHIGKSELGGARIVWTFGEARATQQSKAR